MTLSGLMRANSIWLPQFGQGGLLAESPTGLAMKSGMHVPLLSAAPLPSSQLLKGGLSYWKGTWLLEGGHAPMDVPISGGDQDGAYGEGEQPCLSATESGGFCEVAWHSVDRIAGVSATSLKPD